MLAGYKTYIVAVLMVGYAFLNYVLGGTPDHPAAINWAQVLEGLGLAALRSGVARVGH